MTGPEAGFTLLEIVVAMAILGIGLAIVLQLFSGGLDSARRSAEYTRAVLYAKEKMSEVLSSDDLAPGMESGLFDQGYEWHLDVRPATLPQEEAEAPESSGELYELALRVSWPSEGANREIQVTTLKLVPQQDLSALEKK